jgi:hypothetical protein
VAPFLPTGEGLKEREASAAGLSLKKAYKEIWLGAFPGLVAGPAKDRDLFYSSYLQTYLQRDVKDLAQVGDEAAFLRFLKACAARTAQMLKMTELARDADVSVNTAKKWLSILQASCQVRLLHPYHTSATKRLVKTPKLYFLDTGLCAYLTEWTTPATLEAGAMSGAVLETHVFAELLKSWWHRGTAPPVYYYRDKDGKEIDFVFFQNQMFYPIEVRKSASPRREWAQGFSVLNRFKRGWSEGAVVCLCRDMLPLSEKVTAVPLGVI